MIGADDLRRVAAKAPGEIAQIPGAEADVGLRVVEQVKRVSFAVLAELVRDPGGGVLHQLHQAARAQPAFSLGVVAGFAQDHRGHQRGVQILRERVLRDVAGVLKRMLRALGSLGLQAAALLLRLQIAAGDAHGAGEEDGDAKRDEQHAHGRGYPFKDRVLKRPVDGGAAAA